MASGKPAPELFNFTKEGSCGHNWAFSRAHWFLSRTELSIRPDLIHKLVPQSAEAKLLERGIDVNNFQPLSAES